MNQFNIKKVLITSLILSIAISITLFLILNSINNNPSSNIYYPAPENQNRQFEEYFGEHISSSKVKQLLSLVRTNNITSRYDSKNTIIFINNRLCTDYSIVSGGIQSNHFYKVYVANSLSVEPSNELQLADNSLAPDGENAAGYYSNGYIRNIIIEPSDTFDNSILINNVD